jgi:hypothetical protein
MDNSTSKVGPTKERRRLSESDIPARWVMLYNANLDKTGHRKTPSELRIELRKWEEDQKGRKHVVEDIAAHEVGWFPRR